MVDWNGVFKNWNTLKHEYNLQNNFHFQLIQHISAWSSNWKNIIKQTNNVNTFTTTQQHFIWNSRVLTVQKVTSNELYSTLTTTIEHKPPSQKLFQKKVHWNQFKLERNLYNTLHFFQQYLQKMFSVLIFQQCTFSK